jgi:hypothetical protein
VQCRYYSLAIKVVWFGSDPHLSSGEWGHLAAFPTVVCILPVTLSACRGGGGWGAVYACLYVYEGNYTSVNQVFGGYALLAVTMYLFHRASTRHEKREKDLFDVFFFCVFL